MTTTVMGTPSTRDLILAWDRGRPRSQQSTLGWSEVGGCKRRAGYRLAEQAPTDEGGSLQAALGSMIHDGIADVLKQMQAEGRIPADDLIEHEVEFAGIIGHLDRYEASTATLVDVKSTSSRWLDHIKQHGPGRDHRYQTAPYAAALVKAGRPVRWIRIDYIARDTGEEWSHTRRFDPAEVTEALGWLAEVRDADLDMLPREYAPDGPFCGHCPFRTVCWDGSVTGRDKRSVLYVEDPDAPSWAEKLWQARQDKKAAAEREAEAKGALDALRPDDTDDPVDIGWRLNLKWKVTRPRRLDIDQVKKDYAQTGHQPPYKESTETVTLAFTTPDEEDAS